MSSSPPTNNDHSPKEKDKESEKGAPSETKSPVGGEPLPNELKGGHAPAEKIAGGVRIARRERNHSSSRDDSSASPTAKKEGDEEGEEARAEDGDVARQSGNVLTKSGLAAQTKKDYPEEAVKAFHEGKSFPPQHPTPPARETKAHTHRDQRGNQFQPR